MAILNNHSYHSDGKQATELMGSFRRRLARPSNPHPCVTHESLGGSSFFFRPQWHFPVTCKQKRNEKNGETERSPPKSCTASGVISRLFPPSVYVMQLLSLLGDSHWGLIQISPPPCWVPARGGEMTQKIKLTLSPCAGATQRRMIVRLLSCYR